jgi:hypothetical protein
MIAPPPHTHRWGPCIVKAGGAIRKRMCTVTGCFASTGC